MGLQEGGRFSCVSPQSSRPLCRRLGVAPGSRCVPELELPVVLALAAVAFALRCSVLGHGLLLGEEVWGVKCWCGRKASQPSARRASVSQRAAPGDLPAPLKLTPPSTLNFYCLCPFPLKDAQHSLFSPASCEAVVRLYGFLL